jgi:glycosyltransferase involved in cell wall biosynthesis
MRSSLRLALHGALFLGLLPVLGLWELVTLARTSAKKRPSQGGGTALTVIAPYEPGTKSGGSTAIRGLLETLARDFTVTCVGLYAIKPSLGPIRRLLADLLTLALPMPAHCRPFVAAPAEVRRRLKPGEPALIEFMSGSLFLLAGGPLPVRTILRDHEVLVRRLAAEARTELGLGRLVGVLRVAVAWLVCHDIYAKVDRIFTLTPEDGTYLERWFPVARGRVRFVPVAIDVAGSIPVSEMAPSRDEILFLANFYHRPNVEGLQWFLRDVAPHLHPGRTLHLVGLDQGLDQMTLEAGTLRVLRHGFVEDVGGRFPLVKVAVAPVISGGGVRMKNLFLAAHAKAIVTTARGNEGIGFVSGQEALVCANGAEMAAAIEHLLDSPQEANRLGSRAREKVLATFSPDAVRRAYLRELLSPREADRS